MTCRSWYPLFLSLLTILTQAHGLKMVSREQWGARKPIASRQLQTPVPYVFIHHTHTQSCENVTHCDTVVKAIQIFHMDANGWWDIGYNFLVGGGGLVYEGRGWQTVGAHVYGYNSRSIGISFIGKYDTHLPDGRDLTAAMELIGVGVKQGKISESFKLFGHRQASNDTYCPGDALYKEIQQWPHYAPHVPPVKYATKTLGRGSHYKQYSIRKDSGAEYSD